MGYTTKGEMTYAQAEEKAREAFAKITTMSARIAARIDVFGGAVKVIHEEGTILFYECASIVKLGKGWLAIFTEHNGFHVYAIDDLLAYDQYQRNYDGPYSIEDVIGEAV